MSESPKTVLVVETLGDVPRKNWYSNGGNPEHFRVVCPVCDQMASGKRRGPRVELKPHPGCPDTVRVVSLAGMI